MLFRSLVNKEVFHINSDIVNNALNTALEDISVGCNVTVTGVSVGTPFHNGDVVHSTANVAIRPMDVTILSGGAISNGVHLSNNTLNISNLVAYSVDTTMIYVSGADVNNANLTIGTVLYANTTNTTILVNNPYFTQDRKSTRLNSSH